MRLMKNVLMLALVMAIASPAFAAEEEAKKKKGQKKGQQRGAAAFALPKDLGLTEEQEKKVAAVKKAMAEKAEEAQKAIAKVLSPELLKKRAAAMKEAREAGKKRKELQEAVNTALNLSEEQQAALKKAEEAMQKVRMEFRKEVMAFLTDEQKEKLTPKRQGKGKKKKSEDA